MLQHHRDLLARKSGDMSAHDRICPDLMETEIRKRTCRSRNDYHFMLSYASPDRFLFSQEAFRFSDSTILLSISQYFLQFPFQAEVGSVRMAANFAATVEICRRCYIVWRSRIQSGMSWSVDKSDGYCLGLIASPSKRLIAVPCYDGRPSGQARLLAHMSHQTVRCGFCLGDTSESSTGDAPRGNSIGRFRTRSASYGHCTDWQHDLISRSGKADHRGYTIATVGQLLLT